MANISTGKALSSAALFLLISGLAHGQNSIPKQAEANTSEYEIFSAFIRQAFVGKAGSERVALPISRVVIVDTAGYGVSEIEEEMPDEMPWKKLQNFVRREMPTLKRSTFRSFREANQLRAQLQRKFDLPLAYELVAKSAIDSVLHDVADWPKYYKQYPGAQGFFNAVTCGIQP